MSPRRGLSSRFALATGALLLAALARSGEARAQLWQLDTAVSGETNDAIAVDGLALSSGPMTAAMGQFQLSVPAGSTVVAATLYTVVRFRRDLLAASLPGNLRIAGVSILNDGGPPVGAPAVLAGARCWAGSVCLYTHRFDVTAQVRAALTNASATLPMFAVPFQELGDSPMMVGGVGDVFSFQGHTLVVRYSNSRTMARKRFFGVWWGVADESAESLAFGGLPAPERSTCPMIPAPVMARDENVTLSVSVAGLENLCGEDNVLNVQRLSGRIVSMTGIGGADDAVPAAPNPNCANLGRSVDFRALYTAGSFGGATGMGTSMSDLLTGAAVEVDGDLLFRDPAPPRTSDELFSLSTAPTSIQLQRSVMVGPPKALSVVAMQYPTATADSDGDGHSDIAEGICTRIDTDRDSNAREDWDDTDSDNDCIPDVRETAENRVVRAPFDESDRVCASATPSTPFCQFISGGCQSCATACGANALGHVCTRLGSGELGCGCRATSDCPSGAVCDPAQRQCVRAGVDAGADAALEASVDASLADGASDGGVIVDAMVDGASVDGASVDGAMSADGATEDASATPRDSSVMIAPGITGGACDCRAGVGRTAATRGAWGVIAMAAGALAAARRRRRIG